MPIEDVSDSDFRYYLLAYDRRGHARADDPDGLMHELVLDVLRQESISDVLVLCHGWLRDLQASRKNFSAWVRAFGHCHQDRERAGGQFSPLIICLHWPSLPWGDESMEAESMAFDGPGSGGAESPEEYVKGIVEQYSHTLADSPKAREAMHTIVTASMDQVDASQVPPEVAEAYRVLHKESKMNSVGGFISEGVNRAEFDVEESVKALENDVVSFGIGSSLGGLLWPLRQLSFWKMKDRARRFGQGAGYTLLRELQKVTDARFHLVGHGFGCVALSAMLAGPDRPNRLVRPIDSLVLLQAAMSSWSYAASRPSVAGPGYFNSIIADDRVAGPIVATYSEHDTALNRIYPLAAGIAGQVSFAPGEVPKYGAAGAYGLRGPGLKISDASMLPLDGDYHFPPGEITNLEASQFIREGRGFVGAHNDVTKPEVAHIVWQAMRQGIAVGG